MHPSRTLALTTQCGIAFSEPFVTPSFRGPPRRPESVYSAAMLYVACSGFPVPVSRYWSLFPAVEISDTELGIPGSGTVRRWLRESPEGYAFTALAPQELGVSGFAKTKENKAVLEAFAEFAETLGARAVVFQAPEEIKPTKAAKTALKAFVSWLPGKLGAADGPRVVFDLPSWKPAEIVAAGGKKVIAAYDPLQDEPPKDKAFAYLRLPGPAGHRSRYDEDAVEKIITVCERVKADVDEVFVVFRNIDMLANGTAVHAKVGGA